MVVPCQTGADALSLDIDFPSLGTQQMWWLKAPSVKRG
jgi:hypothetical protein